MSNKLVPITNTGEVVVAGHYDTVYSDFDATTQETSGWPWINLKDQVFRLTPKAPGESEIEVLVVAAMRANLHRHPYQEGKKNISTPICYAHQEQGKEENTMKPPADWPTRVHEQCFDCPLNAWGSGRGDAKECSNQVHLAVLPADDLDPDVLATAPGRRVAVSPTALRAWSDYVKFLKGKGLAPFQVQTNLSFEGKALRFYPTGVLSDVEVSDAVYGRYKEAVEALHTPYKKPGEGTDPKPAARTRTVRRASGADKRKAKPHARSPRKR